MNRSGTRAYRAAVALAFGLAGFGVNFLDVEILKGAPFKISILAGLLFPLAIALAWGWRHGLLSALAGGCQTMWWLWSGDGWGLLYSVPVFTLWIVWHGWWAGRRSEGHPWYVSSFAVEIPFRIVIELGFLVVFRWLVSLNPPPWNPAVAPDPVSAAWLHTVTVKHVLEAYTLLMAAYVMLCLGPVRRFLGLPARPAQRDTTAILAGAALFGLLLWVLEALADSFVFPGEGRSFWSVVAHGAGAHEWFLRSAYAAAALLGGILLARMNRSRVELQELLDHRNRILAAIRNVNQLIVREKDTKSLLDEACRLLVENRGYDNAWICLTVDGRPVEPFHHAGSDSGFSSMAGQLRTGVMPACAQAALSSGRIVVNCDSSDQCADCPVSRTSPGRTCLVMRLEHAGRVFGWLSLSCPARFAHSTDEHELIREVAGDLAFALWSIETEARRETLACKYATVLAGTSDAIVAVDPDGRITVFNPGAEKMFGCTADAVLGTPVSRFCPEDCLAEQADMLRRVREAGTVVGHEVERLTADGRRIPVEITLDLATDDRGRPLGINGILRDITDRRRMEVALRESEAQLRELVQNLCAGVVLHAPDTRILLANEQASIMLGLSPDQMMGKTAIDPAWHFVREDESVMPVEEYPVRQVLANRQAIRDLVLGIDRPATHDRVWVVVNAFPEFDARDQWRQVVVTFFDITARKRAEEEREKLQAQLTQAQKMESVGRLAGGVAHDFNNMLSVILGHTGFALEKVASTDPLHTDLVEIQKAAQRSADLTRQLLAFARKQTVAPRVLDLNESIGNMLKLLRRLIGEDIDLAWKPATGLWPVMMDPVQIDQVLANLCINARDAIAGVGRITIETDNVAIDENYCRTHTDSAPGEYALLTVSDSGCGMDAETVSHLFEPFFTTKELGKGTGLGLATVYGVVRQNNGFIHVYSEPGLGTTFRIYLPTRRAREAPCAERETNRPADRGHETILLVEDEPAILRMATMMLEQDGYTVVAAGTPGEAIRLANEHQGTIHLLISDVVMPEMNGRSLTRNILSLYPRLKSLFMSGYTANVIAHHGVLDEGINFIQKPFAKGDLAAKVREVLDRDQTGEPGSR